MKRHRVFIGLSNGRYGGVVLLAFVLALFFKTPPLRAKSALQEAADDAHADAERTKAEAAAGAGDSESEEELTPAR